MPHQRNVTQRLSHHDNTDVLYLVDLNTYKPGQPYWFIPKFTAHIIQFIEIDIIDSELKAIWGLTTCENFHVTTEI